LRQVTQDLVAQAPADPELAYWLADDYLRAVAVLLLSWAWLKIDAAQDRLSPDTVNLRWHDPAQAVNHWVLPEFGMRLDIMRARLGKTATQTC
jgi:hypothetical protein